MNKKYFSFLSPLSLLQGEGLGVRFFKKYISFLSPLFFFLLPIASFSQSYSFDNFTVNDGLVQSNVFSLLQDNDGYVWLGTENGVSRFDGKVFQNYYTEDGLADNHTRVIIKDKNGNIWFGHKNGSLTFYNGKIFKEINSSFLPKENEIFAMSFDKSNGLWLSTAKYGAIHIINPYGNFDDKNNFKSYTSKTGLSDLCYSTFQDKSGNNWFLTDIGIKILDSKTEKIEFLKIDGIPGAMITSFFYDKNGKVWLGFLNGNISIYNPENNEIVNYTEKDGLPSMYLNAEPSGEVKYQFVKTFMQDNKGTVWASIFSKGFVRFNGDNAKEKFTTFNTQSGLSSNSIIAMACDRESNILLGTLGSGFALYKGEKFVSFSKENGIIGNQVYAILQDKKKRFWWGTNEGITIYDSSLEKSKRFINISDIGKTPTKNVTALKLDNQGNVWIGKWGGGVIMFDSEKEKFVSNPKIDESTYDYVSSIELDKEGKIWIGTLEGITVYDQKNNSIKTFRTIDGLSSNQINCIFSDSKGSMWIGTLENGISVYKDGKFTNYNKAHGLKHLRISIITEDQSGNIWIGSEGGGIFQFKDNQFRNFKVRDGLNSDFITVLTIDESNNLWIGSNKGLNKFDSTKKTFSSYSSNGGFTGIETKRCASYKDDIGNLWFGTVNGVFKYSPAKDVKNEIPPLVKITGLKVNLKDVQITDTLNLSYQENSFKIDFIAICLSNPDAVQYAVMLENHDTDWRPVTKQPFEIISNLSPGNYIFKVKASNNNGVWTQTPVSIYINIKPPFWKTWWFIVLCIITCIVAFFSYVKFRERKLVKEKHVLEEKVVERTAEIAEQKKEIEEKNNDITASIRYAKRIQDAILPPDELVRKHLPKTFILFKPKDIVSGDFYWLYDKHDKILFAAVDCTGHGVPGAFMSIVGHNLLDQIVAEQKLTKPAEILDALNKSVSDTLRQTNADEKVKDGMDIALCAFDRNTHIFEYAGAYNPLWLIRNGELIETKADKFPIGNLKIGEQKKFTNHAIQLIKGDTLYVFSDGFADQFGGSAGKKLKYSTFKKMLIDTQHMSMEEQGEYLKQAIEKWQGQLEQVDDILVIGTRL